jgi:uncharacterized iron-regulated protein
MSAFKLLCWAALTATLTLARAQDAPSNTLPIGRSGTVLAAPTQITDTRTGRPVKLEDIVRAANGKPFVFLGEEHATTAHQLLESQVVDALAQAGRHVTVGMEMFTRPKQDVLDDWSKDALPEDQFLDTVDWKHQWGYPYDFYRPVLEVVRQRHLPLIALNIPRDWVHKVATSNFDALPTSARLQLPPDIYLGNTQHRQVFDSLMGGHAMTGSGMDGMYAAQVLWDESMADTAVKYIRRQPADPAAVFVTISGSGHVLYGQGINYRVARDGGGKGITIVMLQSNTPITVSRGIADFVYVSPVEKKPAN